MMEPRVGVFALRVRTPVIFYVSQFVTNDPGPIRRTPPFFYRIPDVLPSRRHIPEG